MKKIFLTFLILATATLVLASCESVTTDIVVGGVAQYTVVRSDEISDPAELSHITELMNTVSDAVEAKSGVILALDNDWVKKGTEPDPAKKEILIGDTNRPETKEAMESLGESDYAIRQIGNKIVIVGKSDYLLSEAVKFFAAEHLGKRAKVNGGDLAISGAVDYFSGKTEYLDLGEYEIVYTRDAADPFTYSYYDYTFDELSEANDLAEKIGKEHGVYLKVTRDYVYEGIEDEYGILLGRCEREETEAVKKELAFNEYAIKTVGNKVVVTGHGFLSTHAAIEKFYELLDRFAITDDGKTSICIPHGFSYVGVMESGEDWDLSLPEYEGGEDFSVSDLGDGAYLLKVNETTKDEYLDHIKKIENSGAKKYTENEIEGNLFATYISETSVIHLQYAPVYNRTSIAVEPVKTAGLFELEKDNDKTVVTTPKLIQLKVFDETVENGGMCYIIRLENGKFIVVDCGQEEETAFLIYEQLVENNVLEGKPQIAAWIFTHWHGDHYITYTKYFLPLYGDNVDVEKFVYSFPMDRYYFGSTKLASYKGFTSATRIGDVIRPHAGDVMHLGNMKLTFLYTQDEFLPRTFEFFNDSSLTFMIEYEGQKILITGDASENSCNIMLDMYPEYLKCDILQVPHHGHYGANNAFMDATDPSVALIPASEVRWNEKLTRDYYWGAAPLRYLLGKGGVKEYYVQGMGTVAFDLPYSIK